MPTPSQVDETIFTNGLASIMNDFISGNPFTFLPSGDSSGHVSDEVAPDDTFPFTAPNFESDAVAPTEGRSSDDGLFGSVLVDPEPIGEGGDLVRTAGLFDWIPWPGGSGTSNPDTPGSGSTSVPTNVPTPDAPNPALRDVTRNLPAGGSMAERGANVEYSIADTETRTSSTNPGPIPLDARFSSVPDDLYTGPRRDPPDTAHYTFVEIPATPGSFTPLVDNVDGNVKGDVNAAGQFVPAQPDAAGGAVLNGTFFATEKLNPANTNPTGAIIVNGSYATNANGEELFGTVEGITRGGIAQLDDGRIVVGTAFGSDRHAIDTRYSGADSSAGVESFMGGGALLIPPPGNKLHVSTGTGGGQNFTGDLGTVGGSGGTKQFDRSNHSLIGIRDGKAYAIGATDRNGAQLQDDLEKMGFTAVVKLDGGQTSYFDADVADGNLFSGRDAGQDESTRYGIEITP